VKTREDDPNDMLEMNNLEVLEVETNSSEDSEYNNC